MKLEAYIPSGVGTMECLTPSSNWTRVPGGYYRVADVDDLLARIRAAVEVEREAAEADAVGFRVGTGGNLASVYGARSALDTLLSGEG